MCIYVRWFCYYNPARVIIMAICQSIYYGVLQPPIIILRKRYQSRFFKDCVLCFALGMLGSPHNKLVTMAGIQTQPTCTTYTIHYRWVICNYWLFYDDYFHIGLAWLDIGDGWQGGHRYRVHTPNGWACDGKNKHLPFGYEALLSGG